MKMQVTYDCHDMKAYVKKLFVVNVQRYDEEVDIFGSYKLQRSVVRITMPRRQETGTQTSS
jgi:hypothetical protein